ncbi:hypothetical protein EYZ11_003388 [Aspergillus tanneri]|uniref:Uncharacterized protein n=1 Tax=Aspergillus tanneri TaxID=1220188 RepID=A0A4S3JNK6_9EURO|nr:hypothetical protein EYZ11_003388 [Aspergillus tanneri]
MRGAFCRDRSDDSLSLKSFRTAVRDQSGCRNGWFKFVVLYDGRMRKVVGSWWPGAISFWVEELRESGERGVDIAGVVVDLNRSGTAVRKTTADLMEQNNHLHEAKDAREAVKLREIH